MAVMLKWTLDVKFLLAEHIYERISYWHSLTLLLNTAFINVVLEIRNRNLHTS